VVESQIDENQSSNRDSNKINQDRETVAYSLNTKNNNRVVDENNVYSQDKQLQKPDSYQRSNYVPISDATPNWNETAKDFKVIVVNKEKKYKSCFKYYFSGLLFVFPYFIFALGVVKLFILLKIVLTKNSH
jgi:hypothetical protein